MEFLPNNEILEFLPDTLEAVKSKHGFEKSGKMKETVDLLEKWMLNQKLNKKNSRHYLETTIIASKGSLDRAQRRLENVVRQRKEHPQFFGNFHVKNDFKEFQGIVKYAILPKLTKDYNRILLIKNTGKLLKPNFIMNFARIFIIVFEYLKVKDYSDGVIAILDLTEVGLMETVRRINLQELRLAASILIDGYGVRVKGLHVISESKIVNALVWIFKQVLSAKLVSRIHVHQSTKTIQNFVTKDILPVEYGGTEKSLKNIHEQWEEVLSSEEFRSYLSKLCEPTTD